MNRDYYVFNISFILRTLGLGIFTTLFNIYILSCNNYSSHFLESFLAIGNISIAISSYLVGISIDKYSKKILMIIFTIICGICIYLESSNISEPLMYIVSIIYGVGAAGLFTLTPTVLKKYEFENRRNLIVVNRAINIISTTVGALIAGVLTKEKFNISLDLLLHSVAIIYFISAAIYLFHSDTKDKKIKEKHFKHNSYIPPKLLYITMVLFLLLGFAPMLANYINIYLMKRLSLNISNTSYAYAFIYLLSGLIIIKLSQIDFENIHHILLLCFSIVVVNISLIFFTSLFMQMINICLYICLYEIFISCLYEFVLSKGGEKIHGRLSGIIQTFSNLSETVGIYVCGIMLENNNYIFIFGVGIITTLICVVITVILLKNL